MFLFPAFYKRNKFKYNWNNPCKLILSAYGFESTYEKKDEVQTHSLSTNVINLQNIDFSITP